MINRHMRFVAYIISLMLIMQSLSATAQDSFVMPQGDSLVVNYSRIYYPVNKVEIYEDYMNNNEELEKIKLHLLASPRIDSIAIYSYASPEGSYEFNKWLAAERGKTAKRYILANIPKNREFPDSLIRIQPVAENWMGMREEVAKRYTLSDKDNVLKILDMAHISDVHRKQMLRSLNGGRSWQYILKNIMPHLRYATWVSVWYPIVKTELEPEQLVDTVSLEFPIVKINSDPKIDALEFKPYVTEEYESDNVDTKTILALKTNMLYDAVSWLNYSIEVPFGRDRFSMLYYHQFPWWRWGQSKNEYCIRFLGIGGEYRWWFKPEPREETEKRKKRDRLVGHYLGVYGESGKYDFERKTDICYQGEYWSVGLSYGYSMPISKRLNLEFSISGGYASIVHRGYTPSPDYSILWRDYNKIGCWHYWGLTKAQVSLVVPIVVKVKKGGRQ